MINQEVPVWRQNPLDEKKKKSCSSFTLFQVFQVQIFLNLIVLPTEKVARYKNRPDLK